MNKTDIKKWVFENKPVLILSILLLLFGILHDTVFHEDRIEDLKLPYQYSFSQMKPRLVQASLSEETDQLMNGKTEQQQVVAFTHILERNRYLLYKKKITPASYYDFIVNFLHPHQKSSLKSKIDYKWQITKYLRRLRRANYEYIKYQMTEPEFYFKDLAREAEVTLIRTTPTNTEKVTYYFRKYQDRYYLYLK